MRRVRGPIEVRWLSVVVIAVSFVSVSLPAVATEEPDPGILPVLALFEGDMVRMDVVWDAAGACAVWPEAIDAPECFRTEAEMNARITELKRLLDPVPQWLEAHPRTVASSCSSSVRLYDGTSYGGSVLYISGRFQWFDLASFGFNNRTSSFKIGACSAYFADLAAGGGSWYPTSQTQAYDVASSMVSGWNDDVSSLYIT